MSDIRVSDIGEFGLISRIARLLPSARDGTLVGGGDDVAVVRPLAANYLLLTSDALVEGVHSLKDRIGAQELGWKLVAIDVSDIAAMSGEPRHLLLSRSASRYRRRVGRESLRRCMRCGGGVRS